MKAMLLAAGRGERMRPLTDDCPKPMLEIHGKPLLQHAIDRLRTAGITELVINVSWLSHCIEDFFEDGRHLGVHIEYSREPASPLETGGGIAQALPLLTAAGPHPFLLVNSDVWCDYDFQKLVRPLSDGALAHLVLVSNPAHHIGGDFVLHEGRVVDSASAAGGDVLTYSGIALLDPELFARYAPRRTVFPLREVLQPAISAGQVSGEIYTGVWVDVGTPERLETLRQSFVR